MADKDTTMTSSPKKKNIYDVFTAISTNEDISRADIAKQTGISVMTVGKIADSLIAKNLAVQTKESKSSSGRKAGLLSLNPLHFAVIISLYDSSFSIDVFGTKMTSIYRYEFEYDENASDEINIEKFLSECKNIISSSESISE